jgi:hypothetical protein
MFQLTIEWRIKISIKIELCFLIRQLLHLVGQIKSWCNNISFKGQVLLFFHATLICHSLSWTTLMLVFKLSRTLLKNGCFTYPLDQLRLYASNLDLLSTFRSELEQISLNMNGSDI